MLKPIHYSFPRFWISYLVGWFADRSAGFLTAISIFLFIKYYNVNMNEIETKEIRNYSTFNHFFIRKLKGTSRPINTGVNTLISPVDGTISELGNITENSLLQAKGITYTIQELLGGDTKISDLFFNGKFVTIYLSPANYHRVHMSCNGILKKLTYIKGNLISVNYSNTKKIPNLFIQNERIICYFDTVFGPFIQILVGAIFVGSIKTIWSEKISKNTLSEYFPQKKEEVIVKKGKEIGYFKVGASTVISLFPHRKVILDKNLSQNSSVVLGKRIGVIKSALKI